MDYIFGEGALITPKDIARFGLNGEIWLPGVATNITPLFTIGGA